MDNQEKQKAENIYSSLELLEFRLEKNLKGIVEDVHKSLPDGKRRFDEFVAAFNKAFPERTNKEHAIKGAAEALTWALLNVPLALFFIGQNSSVFVELHAFLERFVLRDLPHLLSNNKESAAIISSLIERKTLTELADSLLQMKIWNEEDVRFARRLASIRNGIVHKNAKLISKHLSNGKDIHISEIDRLTGNADCIPFLIGSINLLVKLSGAGNIEIEEDVPSEAT